jgi:hypothetical protein
MKCKSKFCGEEIVKKGRGKMYKNLCYECSIGEKVWRKIKKEGDANCVKGNGGSE